MHGVGDYRNWEKDYTSCRNEGTVIKSTYNKPWYLLAYNIDEKFNHRHLMVGFMRKVIISGLDILNLK